MEPPRPETVRLGGSKLQPKSRSGRWEQSASPGPTTPEQTFPVAPGATAAAVPALPLVGTDTDRTKVHVPRTADSSSSASRAPIAAPLLTSMASTPFLGVTAGSAGKRPPRYWFRPNSGPGLVPRVSALIYSTPLFLQLALLYTLDRRARARRKRAGGRDVTSLDTRRGLQFDVCVARFYLLLVFTGQTSKRV